ncbi:TPA: N-acetyltransferase [Candidatus Poribacteria bacterium]|nr:N-acetyltransferase [Candidatus Poribacteria bacterium]
MTYFVHESSYVDEPVTIGLGTKVWHFSHIMKGAIIGRDCVIGQNVYIDTDVVIGNNAKIQNNVSVFKKVTLEDNVFCGPSAVFTNVINPRSAYPKEFDEYSSTLVKQGATIGANATIICGVIIGEFAFIGAGSVVTRDVLPYALMYGNPARQHGWMSESGNKLDFQKKRNGALVASCSTSQTEYILKNNRMSKINENHAD